LTFSTKPVRLWRPVTSDAAEPRRRAALDLAKVDAELHQAGTTLFTELHCSAGDPQPGEHYPPGEVWDAETHAQYFYHAHPESQRAGGEHGHFHLFLGQRGMPAGMPPLLLPEMGLPPRAEHREPGDPGTHRSPRDRGVFSHLIGISVDAYGRPISLFTTNRWVTGETWYRAEDVVRMLDCFDFAVATATLLDRWLVAILRLLKPDIVDLVRARDVAIMDWRRRRARQHHVFDDRRLEIVSQLPVNFVAELNTLLAGMS
jgi:hypothetical protein